MGHLLCFYLLELGMAAAWCRWVICREVDLPALLRTARTVERGTAGAGELLLVRRRWTEGEGQSASARLGAGSPCACSLPLLYLTLGGALGPSAGLENVSGGAGQLAMGCCVLAGLAGGCFKAGTQRTVEELSWMQGGAGGPAFPTWVSERAHAAGGVGPEKERAPCLAPAGCGGRFGTIWGLSHSLAAAGPVGEAAALVLLALLWLLSRTALAEEKGEERSSRAGRDHPREQPGRYQEALEDFCRAMKIPALLVTETQEGTVNASARLPPGQVPELRVTGDC